MISRELVVDYAVLPCLLLGSILSWYQGDNSTSLGCLVAWAFSFYISRLFTPESWIVHRQQQQLDEQQQKMMTVIDKVNGLLEKLNETTKRTNDNYLHVKHCNDAIKQIKRDLSRHNSSFMLSEE